VSRRATAKKCGAAGAIGCTLAWGLAHAAMYLMSSPTRRSRRLLNLTALRQTREAEMAHRLILVALPPGLSTFGSETELEALRFPFVIPFHIITDGARALRVSHAVAVSMLFVAGWPLGTHAGRPGWQIGRGMVITGRGLATLAVSLGGQSPSRLSGRRGDEREGAKGGAGSGRFDRIMTRL